MRSPALPSASAWASALAIAVALACGPALAEVRGGETVGVAAGERVEGNLYISGGDITVHGDVNGDLVAAGGSIVIDGHVFGDVLAAGGELKIDGVVDGDVRVLGGEVTMLGRVSGDAAAAGGDITIASTVGGDGFVAAATSELTGDIAGALALAAGDARVAGRIGGDVNASASRLRLERGSVIGGDLAYRGEALDRAPGAVVAGNVVERPTEAGARMFVGWLQALIGICLFGILWLTLFRRFGETAMATLAARPWLSLGIGFLAFFGVPVILGLVLVLGALIGGWWISFIGAAIYFTAIAITFPLVAAFLGRRVILRRRRGEAAVPLSREIGAMVAFLVILGVVMIIPIIGALIALAVILFGLGAIAVTLVPTLRRTRQPAPVTVTAPPAVPPAMPATPSPA